jgi:hypothetical protein
MQRASQSWPRPKGANIWTDLETKSEEMVKGIDFRVNRKRSRAPYDRTSRPNRLMLCSRQNHSTSEAQILETNLSGRQLNSPPPKGSTLRQYHECVQTTSFEANDQVVLQHHCFEAFENLQCETSAGSWPNHVRIAARAQDRRIE